IGLTAASYVDDLAAHVGNQLRNVAPDGSRLQVEVAPEACCPAFRGRSWCRQRRRFPALRRPFGQIASTRQARGHGLRVADVSMRRAAWPSLVTRAPVDSDCNDLVWLRRGDTTGRTVRASSPGAGPTCG